MPQILIDPSAASASDGGPIYDGFKWELGHGVLRYPIPIVAGSTLSEWRLFFHDDGPSSPPDVRLQRLEATSGRHVDVTSGPITVVPQDPGTIAVSARVAEVISEDNAYSLIVTGGAGWRAGQAAVYVVPPAAE